MVKYCLGNRCKKKRKTKWHYIVQQGVSYKKKVPVANNQIDQVAPSRMAAPVTMAERNWAGLDFYASKYVPGFSDAKKFAEGWRDKDYLKAALGIGGAAYSIGTLFAPEMKIGNLAKGAFKATSLGRDVYRTKDMLSRAFKYEANQVYNKASDYASQAYDKVRKTPIPDSIRSPWGKNQEHMNPWNHWEGKNPSDWFSPKKDPWNMTPYERNTYYSTNRNVPPNSGVDAKLWFNKYTGNYEDATPPSPNSWSKPTYQTPYKPVHYSDAFTPTPQAVKGKDSTLFFRRDDGTPFKMKSYKHFNIDPHVAKKLDFSRETGQQRKIPLHPQITHNPVQRKAAANAAKLAHQIAAHDDNGIGIVPF